MALHHVHWLYLAWLAYEIWEGFSLCRKLWSFVRNAALTVWAVVDIIRSPERYLQALFEPLMASAAKWLGYISIFAVGFGTAWLFCCRPCSRRL